MISLTFRAYGKINPFLYVGKKREDGFHEVVTVMQKATVYDTVTLTETEEKGIRITTDNDELPTNSENLVYRAIVELHKAIGKPIEEQETGYTIRIEKRIPIKGGMGGGSADAGYTLRHLNRALGNPLSADKLCEIAAMLGSDVPFFLYEGNAMLATGRGEILTECAELPPCRMEFVSCGAKPSTGAIFNSLDRAREAKATLATEPTVNNVLKALERGNLREICDNFYNSFEAVFRAQSEEYEEKYAAVKKELTAKGAVGVLLCGSGPTVCGIFEK